MVSTSRVTTGGFESPLVTKGPITEETTESVSKYTPRKHATLSPAFVQDIKTTFPSVPRQVLEMVFKALGSNEEQISAYMHKHHFKAFTRPKIKSKGISSTEELPNMGLYTKECICILRKIQQPKNSKFWWPSKKEEGNDHIIHQPPFSGGSSGGEGGEGGMQRVHPIYKEFHKPSDHRRTIQVTNDYIDPVYATNSLYKPLISNTHIYIYIYIL